MGLGDKLIDSDLWHRNAAALLGQVPNLSGGANNSVASAGNSQGTGTLLANAVQAVTGADGTKGVTLPAITLADNKWYFIYNQSASGLKVYPPTGASINSGAANAAITMSGTTSALIVAVSGSQYLALYS